MYIYNSFIHNCQKLEATRCPSWDVLFSWADYKDNLISILYIHEGGLAIYGGIIGGILGIFFTTRYKGIKFLKLTDMAALGVMIAQSMGRWGNFFNGEAFGGIVSESHPLYFMRMGLISSNSIYTFGTTEMVYVHPAFLYESLWNLVGFIIINLFYKKKKFNGQISCMYLAWYGFGRMFIEGLRTDSLYIPGTAIRISQLVGLLCFIVFGALLVWGLIYSRKYAVEGVSLNAIDEQIKPDIIIPKISLKKAITGKEEEKAEEKTEEKSEEKTDGNGN